VLAQRVAAQEERSWLMRMSRAVEELNYEGTFVHMLEGNAETLYIVHRNDEGRIGERIVSLDGAGREIIRQEDEVQCILPDRKIVLLEQRKDASPLVAALPSSTEGLEPHYDLSLYQLARVAQRETQILRIMPKDEYRYGYLLWLDVETAMPLKSQLLDENGRIVEQILFTDIAIVDAIPATALVATIDTAGFTWLRARQAEPATPGSVGWRAARVPGGFRLSVATQSTIAGSEYPVDHLVYSDGLATVSVFIEDPKTQADMSEGFSRVGSTNAFSLTVRGRQVTAIGEVPRQTVRTIASSLRAE
jgi:sigma-E factor negative regulatory protein RseB